MKGYTYEIVGAVSDGFPNDEVKEWLDIDSTTGAIHTKKHPLPIKVKQIRLYISMKKDKREVPVELIINVVDTSDTTPFFNKKSYKAVVSEDIRIGSRLLQVDADADGESPLKYILENVSGPPDLLEIDDEGFIKNKAKLDFESYRKLEGRVIAMDRDGNNASTNFSVLLTDANDNRPVFVNGSVFTAYIEESAEIGTILDLPYPLATDGDKGPFSRLLYTLVGEDGHFKIDKNTSEISLTSKLDYEIQRSHSLTVRCVDNAEEEPFNEVFASVTVLVRDVNDNPPVIHNSDLNRLTVSENTPINTTITILSVSDADEGS
ncbi:Cadherin domain protein [Trichostrongylus colubriformis]|uniref:Cadherin domain protein n=1 Tax=Trichostrongylus colubriformis TaxID=6319 RepID=A0AAN8FDH4_TRICO